MDLISALALKDLSVQYDQVSSLFVPSSAEREHFLRAKDKTPYTIITSLMADWAFNCSCSQPDPDKHLTLKC